MNNIIKNIEPVDEEIFADEKISLGHVRLSTISLSLRNMMKHGRRQKKLIDEKYNGVLIVEINDYK
jgi:hypothetical protein